MLVSLTALKRFCTVNRHLYCAGADLHSFVNNNILIERVAVVLFV